MQPPLIKKLGAAAFKGTLNYNFLRIEHQSYLKKLNDLLVDNALNIKGLRVMLADVDKRIENGDGQYTLDVPNKRAKMIPIRRNLVSLRKRLAASIDAGENVRSVVFMVSIVEDYIASNLRQVLVAYPKKLLLSSKGNAARSDSYNVPFADILDAGSYSKILEQRAHHRVRDALYASPEQYSAYFKAVTGVEVELATWNAYAEIKATRDLYVHGDGIINPIYISKIGDIARGGVGDIAPVDSAYFDTAASCLKYLMSQIYVGMRASYKDSTALHGVFLAQLREAS